MGHFEKVNLKANIQVDLAQIKVSQTEAKLIKDYLDPDTFVWKMGVGMRYVNGVDDRRLYTAYHSLPKWLDGIIRKDTSGDKGRELEELMCSVFTTFIQCQIERELTTNNIHVEVTKT